VGVPDNRGRYAGLAAAFGCRFTGLMAAQAQETASAVKDGTRAIDILSLLPWPCRRRR
jgi:hypothetical protein